MTFRYITGEVVPIADRAAAEAMPRYHLPTCFGCGPDNPDRLGVEPRLEGDKIVAELSFPPRFEGGPGVVHGGATAAFFDDLIGFVAMAHMLPAVTARLEINYLQPMPIGVTIRGEAWLASRRGRKLFTEAVGTGPGRTDLCRGAGVVPRCRDRAFRQGPRGGCGCRCSSRASTTPEPESHGFPLSGSVYRLSHEDRSIQNGP